MYSVYALSDPRTNEVHYVGCTVLLRDRMLVHMTGKNKSNPIMQAWIDELKSLGMRPKATILDKTESWRAAPVRERWWIQFYLREGAPLANKRDATRWDEERWVEATKRMMRANERRQQSAS